jgi:type I restriction enzyme M protein
MPAALFKKETNTNTLTEAHIAQLMQVFDSKANAGILCQISGSRRNRR